MEFSASVAQHQIDYLDSKISDDQRFSQQSNINGVNGSIGEMRANIQFLEEQLKETLEEIESVKSLILHKCISNAERIKNSDSAVCKLFVKI